MVCLLYWSGHALKTSEKRPSSCPLSFKVSFLEMDPTHLKCAVNFFFSAKDGTQGLADSLSVPA